jgi:hypothetical protein
MPTTIGRNRRQYVINVRTEYTECRRYNPVTGEMDRCDSDEAWQLLDANRNARLIENDDQTAYTITHRSDLYELRKPARPTR